MSITRYPLVLPFIFFIFISCEQSITEKNTYSEVVNQDELLFDIQHLSSDEMEGRRTGTEGNSRAINYIEQRFELFDLKMFDNSYRHYFDHTSSRSEIVFEDAVNLIGYIEGTENSDQYIVLTAHFDHLGIEDGKIYNGADDNASGTAGLLAAIRYFSENQPENSIIIIAFDAEEQGLGGSRHFVDNPVVPLEQIVMNVNMDMISNNFDSEIYAVGTYHYPFLKPLIEEAVTDAEINVLFGYDSEDWDQDWTMLSDHGPFHLKGIPFIYFGVEDHPHYHKPTDTFENINPDFFIKSVETIIGVVSHLDQNLDVVIEASRSELNQ